MSDKRGLPTFNGLSVSDRESTSFSHSLNPSFIHSAPSEYSPLHESGVVLGNGYTEMNKTQFPLWGAHSCGADRHKWIYNTV